MIRIIENVKEFEKEFWSKKKNLIGRDEDGKIYIKGIVEVKVWRWEFGGCVLEGEYGFVCFKCWICRTLDWGY